MLSALERRSGLNFSIKFNLRPVHRLYNIDQVLQASARASEQLTCTAQVYGNPVSITVTTTSDTSIRHLPYILLTNHTTVPCSQIYSSTQTDQKPSSAFGCRKGADWCWEQGSTALSSGEDEPIKGCSSLCWTCHWLLTPLIQNYWWRMKF